MCLVGKETGYKGLSLGTGNGYLHIKIAWVDICKGKASDNLFRFLIVCFGKLAAC